MPYQVTSQAKQRVALFEVVGVLSMEEMFAACYQLRDEIFAAVQHKVHIIVDLSQMDGYPQDLKVLTEATKIYAEHPNCGWVVVLGMKNPVAKFLANLMFQIVKAQYKTAANLDDALELLKKVDMGIGD